MLQERIKEFKKHYKKNKKYLAVVLVIILTFYGIVLFFTAFHNIDLLSNYALIFNDQNREDHCDSGFYDIREINDCNGFFQCPDYKQIYITSVNTLFVSFFLLITVIMSFGFYFLKKEFVKK